MPARRTPLLGPLLLLLACAGETNEPRQAQPTAGTPPQPPAAGATAGTKSDGLLPGLPDAGDTFIPPLPDDDGGALTLPSTQAKKPPADPNITFDWTETQPNAATCEPGEYLGMFSCLFTLDDQQAAIFGGTTQLQGDVRLTLVRSMSGEFLEISDGMFEALASSVIGARAMLTGKLDCRTNRFEAMLVNGLWAFGDPAAPLLPGGVLAGTILGMYQDRKLSGEWTLGDPMLGDCVGTWNASLAP